MLAGFCPARFEVLFSTVVLCCQYPPKGVYTFRFTTGGYPTAARFYTHFASPTTPFLLRQSTGSNVWRSSTCWSFWLRSLRPQGPSWPTGAVWGTVGGERLCALLVIVVVGAALLLWNGSWSPLLRLISEYKKRQFYTINVQLPRN